MSESPIRTDHATIVGGGIAGLTAADLLARRGWGVRVYERSQTLGGRAQTQVVEGCSFNLGPHAVYRHGPALKVMSQLGVAVAARPVAAQGSFLNRGRLFPIPADPFSLVRSKALSWRAKIELARILARLRRIGPTSLPQQQSAERWLADQVRSGQVRSTLRALFRLTTFCSEPGRQSAQTTLRQLQLGLQGVCYIDGGWQSWVDALSQDARSRGVDIRAGMPLRGLAREGDGWRLCFADGSQRWTQHLILALPPQSLLKLNLGPELEWLRREARAATPVRIASLNLGLRSLPRKSIQFVLGLDEPLYYSVHSSAARVADPGREVLHLARYLKRSDGYGSGQHLEEMEGLLDTLQPGWRRRVVAKRFLPGLVASYLDKPSSAFLSNRSQGDGPPNLYAIGDWLGHPHSLVDAAACSAQRAAARILADRSPAPFELRRYARRRQTGDNVGGRPNAARSRTDEVMADL